MNQKLTTFLISFFWVTLSCFAQVEVPDKPELRQSANADEPAFQPFISDSVLTYAEFIRWVRQYHPMALSADYGVDLAEGNVRLSRGSFDPLLYGNFRTKEYSETEYYEALQAGIEVPTWMGISLQGGYEDNGGVFLNPESTVPSRGLFNAGLSVQLGNGFLFDERRAALRQAQLGVDMSQNDRIAMLNALYYEATTAYYRWALFDRTLQIAEDALVLAATRYEGVVQSHLLGDLPAIDTVEAYTQVLTRLFDLREAQNNWIDAANMASVYLWTDEIQPIIIPPGLRPEPLTERMGSDSLIPSSITPFHPDLQKLNLERSSFQIERRLATQYVLPKVELKYNVLGDNISPANAEDYFNESVFFENNYTFGAKVAVPLFMREGRGKMAMTRVKIDLTTLELESKRAQLDAKLNSTLVKLANTRDQVSIFVLNVELLERLLIGERELFNIGESSLFLVNSRETKLIEAQVKLVDLIAKERILLAETRVVAGLGFVE